MSDLEDNAIVAIITAHPADAAPYLRLPHILDLFPVRRQAIQFIKDFYSKNGSLPKPKTVKTAFPNVNTLLRPEPLGHCFEELKAGYIETVCSAAGDKIGQAIQSKDFKTLTELARKMTDMVTQAQIDPSAQPTESRDVIKAVADKIDKDGPAALRLMPTGIKPFDDTDGGGLRGGHMYTIASLVSLGKTFVLCRMAEGLRANGFKVGYYSLEMPANDIHMRCLSLRYKTDTNSLVSPLQPDASVKAGEKYEDWYKAQLQAAQVNIDADKATGQLWVIGSDNGYITTARIRTDVERLGLDVVLIDAAQDLRDERETKERTPCLYNAVGEMNAIASTFAVPVVFTVQMDPEVERKGLSKGNLTRIAWGQVFAQKSDVVVTLLGERESNHRDVKVEKSRSGGVGRNFWITLAFHPLSIEASTKPPGTLEDLDKSIAEANSISELDQMLKAAQASSPAPTAPSGPSPVMADQDEPAARSGPVTLPPPRRPGGAPPVPLPPQEPANRYAVQVSPYELRTLRRLHKKPSNMKRSV